MRTTPAEETFFVYFFSLLIAKQLNFIKNLNEVSGRMVMSQSINFEKENTQSKVN